MDTEGDVEPARQSPQANRSEDPIQVERDRSPIRNESEGISFGLKTECYESSSSAEKRCAAPQLETLKSDAILEERLLPTSLVELPMSSGLSNSSQSSGIVGERLECVRATEAPGSEKNKNLESPQRTELETIEISQPQDSETMDSSDRSHVSESIEPGDDIKSVSFEPSQACESVESSSESKIFTETRDHAKSELLEASNAVVAEPAESVESWHEADEPVRTLDLNRQPRLVAVARKEFSTARNNYLRGCKW